MAKSHKKTAHAKKHGKKATAHHRRFSKAAHPRNKLGQFVRKKSK